MKILNLNISVDDQKLKRAFRAVKVDMDIARDNHDALKHSVHEWITYLNRENQDLRLRVRMLERKLETMENSQDEKRLSILSQV